MGISEAGTGQTLKRAYNNPVLALDVTCNRVDVTYPIKNQGS
jgi:hypothetical protein